MKSIYIIVSLSKNRRSYAYQPLKISTYAHHILFRDSIYTFFFRIILYIPSSLLNTLSYMYRSIFCFLYISNYPLLPRGNLIIISLRTQNLLFELIINFRLCVYVICVLIRIS